MTPPRQVIPGQTVMITVEAVGRSFRFLPTKQVAELIRYVFFAALSDFDIAVHEFCFLSNHFHIVLTPKNADLPKFTQKFHSDLSRALNALRGTSGTNFEKDYNIVVETDPEAIMRACAYTLANPVKAHLVRYIRQWKGPNSFKLEYGQEVTVKRPKFGLWKPVDAPTKLRRGKHNREWEPTRRSHRGRWKSPETVTFKLTRPPVYVDKMSDKQVREEIRRRALVREDLAEAERVKNKRKALGMQRVLAQDWFAMPQTRRDMFGPVPKASSSSQWKKKAALQRCREFVFAYRQALREWMAGNREVEFPAGTYKMRVQFKVCCAPAAPS